MKKLNILLIALIVTCFCLQIPAQAQNKITRSVFSNGASVSQSENHRLLATIGQPLIGVSSNGSQVITSGFWDGVSDIATSVEQAEERTLPEEFRLDQNYPNPFNPATTITFALPQQAQVTITLFDILGRQVTVLLDEQREAGEYNLNFQAQDLASGVYFYTMRAEVLSGQKQRFADTKKFMLLK